MPENHLPEGETATAEQHGPEQTSPAPDATPGRPSGKKSAILNALPAHIAHLDRDGTITAINEAWKRLCLCEELEGEPAGVGSNYFTLCEQSRAHFGDKASLIARGIQAVLAGVFPEFSVEYACPSERRPQWFRLIVTPMQRDGSSDGAVVMHLNITEHKRL